MSVSTAASAAVAPEPAPEPSAPGVGRGPSGRARLVLVGGVPGAGKTTLLDAVVATHPRATSVDPERLRRRLARVLPRSVPYRRYRPLVHVWNTVLVLVLLVRGPDRSGRALVVHDPATRHRRRSATGWLARRRGWDPALLMVDVSREAAVAGQHARRRVLAPRAFEGHWQRWEAERPLLLAAAATGAGDWPWSAVHVVDRRTAAEVLTGLLG